MGPKAGEFLKLELLQASDERRWNELVRSSDAPHFYNETPFFYHYAWKTVSLHPLWFLKGDEPVAAIPLALVETDQVRQLRSPFSSSFGGFSSVRIDLAEAYQCVERLLGYAKDVGARSIVIQQPPIIYCRMPQELWEFVLQAFGFQIECSELTYWVPTGEGFVSRMSASTRWAVNRGQRRGLRLEEATVLEAYDFIASSRSAKGLSLSVSRDDAAYFDCSFPGRVDATVVRVEGQVLAASINYLMSPWAALCMFWGRAYGAEKDLRPLDYLIAEYVRRAWERGVKVYDFGTTTLQGTPEWGVTEYKEKFGPLGALRRRFRRELP